jgi:uncharacterized protein YpuA (DUF1002 family)
LPGIPASAAEPTVAAPASKPVSGETALVGLLKAVPTCLGHPVDPRRVQLAYQQFDLLSNLGDLPDASDRLLRMLDDVLSGQPTDAVVQTEGAGLDDNQRAIIRDFLEQLRGLDYGPYNGGFQTSTVSGSYAILPNNSR